MRKSILFVAVLFLSLPMFAQQSRHFTFHYGFTVRNVQPGQKIQVWFPEARSDDFQTVKVLSVKMDTLEKSFRYLKSHVIAISSQEELAKEIDELINGVEAVEEIGSDTEGVLDDLTRARAAAKRQGIPR